MSQEENQGRDGDRLVLLWASGDREVAEKMALMYALNSRLRGWWDRVLLIVWGASVQLLCRDQGLQKRLDDLLQAGVEVQACQACADMYGLSEQLRGMGVEVKYMGEPLTGILKSREYLITV